MRRIILLIAGAIIGSFIGGFHQWIHPHNAHAAAAPTKIAYIEFENQKASTVYDATKMPYLNNNVIPEGIKFTAFKEGTDSHTNPVGSAEQYTYQTSADNCGGVSIDSYWNGGGNPIASGTSGSTCGLSLYRYLTNSGVSWKSFSEYFVAGTTTCTSAFTDTSPHLQYARKHNSSVFYDDTVASPYTSCPNTVGFPQNNAGHAVSDGFTGTGDGFAQVNFITPGLCHDQHSAGSDVNFTDCQSSAPPATKDYFNGDNATTSPCGGAALTNKVKAGDCWLQLNLGDIRRDVGPTGVVLISWDEGTDVTTQESIGMVAIAGTSAAQGEGHLSACPLGGCVDSTTNYDQASILRTMANATTGTACYTGLNASGASDCAGAATLPVNITGTPVQGAQGDNGSSTTTVSATWSSTAASGDFLVAAVSAKGAVTGITAPSGWTLAKQSSGKNVAIYYCPNCTSSSARTGTQTWTFPEAHRATVVMQEIYGIASTSTVDKTGTATSGSDTTRTLGYTGLAGTTAAANEFLVGAVMINIGTFIENWSYVGTGQGECAAGGSNPGTVFEMDQVQAGTVEDVGFAYAIPPTTGTFCLTAEYTDASSYRGAIAAFTN